MDRSYTVINVSGVLGNAHFCQLIQALGLGDTLKCINKSDQVLECASQIFLRLLVLPSETLQILIDLSSKSVGIEFRS